MPIYFFDFDDNGRLFCDKVGSYLTDDSKALREAVSTLFEQVRTTMTRECRMIEIRMRDTTGRVLYRASLQFHDEFGD